MSFCVWFHVRSLFSSCANFCEIVYFWYPVITLLSTVIVCLQGSLLDNSSSKSGVWQLKHLFNDSCCMMRVVLDHPVIVTWIFSIDGAPVCSIWTGHKWIYCNIRIFFCYYYYYYTMGHRLWMLDHMQNFFFTFTAVPW